jgi:hypothetical protein
MVEFGLMSSFFITILLHILNQLVFFPFSNRNFPLDRKITFVCDSCVDKKRSPIIRRDLKCVVCHNVFLLARRNGQYDTYKMTLQNDRSRASWSRGPRHARPRNKRCEPTTQTVTKTSKVKSKMVP